MALGRQYPLIDRILDGQLEQRLRRLREEDSLSYFDTALALREDGVVVSPETVRSWCKALDIRKPGDGEAA